MKKIIHKVFTKSLLIRTLKTRKNFFTVFKKKKTEEFFLPYYYKGCDTSLFFV